MENRVLFVDDEPAVVHAIRRALRHETYEIISAESGPEALQILETKSVDVIVTDEMMPGMSGSDFIAIVRRRFPDTIVMLLTGHADIAMVIRAINVGEVYRFFTKPFDPMELAINIRQAMQYKALIVESRRLLRKVKHQASVLNELERNHPGITNVAAHDDGSIPVDDIDQSLSLEKLISSLQAENQTSSVH